MFAVHRTLRFEWALVGETRSQNSMNICINTCACALFFAQNNMGYRCYDYLFHPVFICYIMDRLQWIYWVFLAPGPQ